MQKRRFIGNGSNHRIGYLFNAVYTGLKMGSEKKLFSNHVYPKNKEFEH